MPDMELEKINDLFETSPAMRLLKSHQAAFVLHFLESAFKRNEPPASGALEHEDLRRRLACYQEDLREDRYEAMSQGADHYLTAWSDEGWLRRFLKSDSNQPYYQLTRHSEDAIRFVDSLLSRQSRFVGTESRLRLVIDTLSDIVRGSSDNPDRRVDDLLAQRKAIDEEIAKIHAGGTVQTYQEAMIRDRFQTAIELLKTLQGDFRAVEDRFERIARDVHSRTQVREQSRGSILASALDAEDLIKQEDEGVSFYAFVAFLFSPASQERLRGVIDELVQLPALSADRDGVVRVRQMLPSLLAEADNVLRQTGRLSETLRRLLDAESVDHRRRIAEVLRDIRTAAAALTRASGNQELLQRIGIDIEHLPPLRSPFSRSFWEAPQPIDGTPVDETIDLTDSENEAFKLAQLQSLHWREMRSTLADMTADSSMVTLAQVVQTRPPHAGVIEVVGWLQIAHEDGHDIDDSVAEKIIVDVQQDSGVDGRVATRRRLEITVPMVRYYSDRIVRPQRGPRVPR